MLKRIDNLYTKFGGDLEVTDSVKNDIKKFWYSFVLDKESNDYFDGDIYCVSDIDDKVPSIEFLKTKFSYLAYAKMEKRIVVRSLFSSGFIRTSDNYICIILNNKGRLNTIGGMASNDDIKDNSYDYNECLIREFKEELGFDLKNNEYFDFKIKYLKYPKDEELDKSHYPVGILFEINTKYKRDELIDLFNKSNHDNEVKELMFYNIDNYKDVYSFNNKTDYLDELFSLIFE